MLEAWSPDHLSLRCLCFLFLLLLLFFFFFFTALFSSSSKMLSTRSNGGQRSPIQIKQDDKFYCRLLARESSAGGAGNPSFRVYYDAAPGAVPFEWESQPGTPKHPCSGAAGAPPPLTPPPSYQCSPGRTASPRKASHGVKLLRAIMPRLTRRKSGGVAPSPQAWQSSPSLSSVRSFPPAGSLHCRRWRRFSSGGSPCSSTGDEEESEVGWPTSTLCFAGLRGNLRA